MYAYVNQQKTNTPMSYAFRRQTSTKNITSALGEPDATELIYVKTLHTH